MGSCAGTSNLLMLQLCDMNIFTHICIAMSYFIILLSLAKWWVNIHLKIWRCAMFYSGKCT